MEQQNERSLGGKLALWVFYAFCGYFVWAMVRYMWVVSKIPALSGTVVEGDWDRPAVNGWVHCWVSGPGTVGLILGGIAWYTRPRADNS
jgi:hypothetical protein